MNQINSYLKEVYNNFLQNWLFVRSNLASKSDLPVNIDGIREPVSGSLFYVNNIIYGAVIAIGIILSL